MLLHDEALTGATEHGFASGTTTRNGRCRRSSRCWRASSTRWKTNTCASARPTSSRWSSACCERWRATPRRRLPRPVGARDFAGEDPLVLVANDIAPADMLQFKRSVFTGFVTDVGRAHLAHSHRGAQHGHPGGGRRARSQPPDPPGRLGHHRWRLRHRRRQPIADRARGVPVPPAAKRARARAAVAAAAYAGGDARRRACRAACQHRVAAATPRPRSRRARLASACSAASSCS